MTHQGLLVADWGTTNLRAWRLGPDGAVLARAEFPLGVARLAPGEAAGRFESEVRPALGAAGLPALLCGMVGSTLGWTVAAYIDCPAGLDTLAGGLVAAAPGVFIVPGLRGAGLVGPDVMRGEETQVLGWLAADPARSRGRHLLCLPGTHAKWVRVEDGAVSRFITAMTGELYGLLGAHGVLRFSETRDDPDAFDRGVAAAGDGGALSARLFSLRGLVLNGALPAASAASWLSGLLIGAEVASLWPLMRAAPDETVALVGDGDLCARYRRVLAAHGVATTIGDGEAAVLAGLALIAKAMP